MTNATVNPVASTAVSQDCRACDTYTLTNAVTSLLSGRVVVAIGRAWVRSPLLTPRQPRGLERLTVLDAFGEIFSQVVYELRAMQFAAVLFLGVPLAHLQRSIGAFESRMAFNALVGAD